MVQTVRAAEELRLLTTSTEGDLAQGAQCIVSRSACPLAAALQSLDERCFYFCINVE